MTVAILQVIGTSLVPGFFFLIGYYVGASVTTKQVTKQLLNSFDDPPHTGWRKK